MEFKEMPISAEDANRGLLVIALSDVIKYLERHNPDTPVYLKTSVYADTPEKVLDGIFYYSTVVGYEPYIIIDA